MTRPRSRVWIVQAEDGARLADVLRRAGADEAAVLEGRVFVGRRRARSADDGVKPGDELTYDYQIGRDKEDPANIDEIYACRCGARSCRGSMLWPPRRKSRTKAS